MRSQPFPRPPPPLSPLMGRSSGGTAMSTARSISALCGREHHCSLSAGAWRFLCRSLHFLAEETEELLTGSLAAMRANLQQTPAWSLAPPPTDDFLLMFLRTEVFSPSAAADRYRKFWKMKVFLCGEEKSLFPIKVEDAEAALKTEYIQLVPGSKDIEGRQVVLITPSNINRKLGRKRRTMAVWFVLLAGLEDTETQRRGFCFVVNPTTVKLSQLDSKFMKLTVESLQGALPLRIGSLNVCYPPTFSRLMWGIISPFLHPKVHERVKVIPGTDVQVKDALGYIVAPENLPPPMGEKALDFSGWLEERTRNQGWDRRLS